MARNDEEICCPVFATLQFTIGTTGTIDYRRQRNGESMSVFELGTLLIALAALGLSVFNTWIQRQAASPKLNVEASIVSNPDSGRLGQWFFFKATNVGDVPVILEKAEVRGPRRLIVPLPLKVGPEPIGTTLPWAYNPGEVCRYMCSADSLAFTLKEAGHSGRVRIRGAYVDHKGRAHHSSRVTIDVDGLTAMPNFGTTT